MIKAVQAAQISGTVYPPASKSIMQRACAAALLTPGTTIIEHPGTSADDNAALQLIYSLGASWIQAEDQVIINSTGAIQPRTSVMHCGESGLSARLFLPIAALSDAALTLDGQGSLRNRPMQEHLDVLPQLGVRFADPNPFLPVRFQGPLSPQNITVSGKNSSQFLTGLLFALAAAAQSELTITVQDLASKPYIDLTLDVLNHFGWQVAHEQYERFHIRPGRKPASGDRIIRIPTDWSSAAFWLVAGALSGPLTVTGLDMQSTQADKLIRSILEQAGAGIVFRKEAITVTQAPLQCFSVDLRDAPDLFPIVSVLAAAATGTSTLVGLSRLTHKESNRAASIRDMLSQLHIPFDTNDDSLIITGVSQFAPATINGYNDHRIVMAAAVASLRCQEPLCITDTKAVAKSYPAFWEHASSLGFVVHDIS